MSFNKTIKEIRNKKGLSQEELATQCGLSLRTIQRIESGETNPTGDTKRKILKILEPYPDTDFANTITNSKRKNILHKISKKWQYILVIYAFMLLSIFIGFAGFKMFLEFGLIIGFLCLIALSISTVHKINSNGWKKGSKYLVISLSSILIYFFVISIMIPVKSTKIEIKDGVKIKVERNLITGENDTIKTTVRDIKTDY